MANMTTLQILQGIKTWVTTKLNLKQDVINDLANIRSGAQAGSTAVQPAELSAYFNDASYDNNTHRINFYHGQTVVAYVDASPFIIDGMVDDVRIENGYLVIDFNTASGKQDISIPLTDIFNPNNYYNKTQTDGLLAQKQDVIQDLADIRSGASAGSTAVQPSTLNNVVKNVVAESGVYDVSANNDNTKFESLSALLSSANLNTLIPTDIRKGGMSIKFVLSSDNKYVSCRYLKSDATTPATFTDIDNWQGVTDEPVMDSHNLITSGAVDALNHPYSNPQVVQDATTLTASSSDNGTYITIEKDNNDNFIFRKIKAGGTRYGYIGMFSYDKNKDSYLCLDYILTGNSTTTTLVLRDAKNVNGNVAGAIALKNNYSGSLKMPLSKTYNGKYIVLASNSYSTGATLTLSNIRIVQDDLSTIAENFARVDNAIANTNSDILSTNERCGIIENSLKATGLNLQWQLVPMAYAYKVTPSSESFVTGTGGTATNYAPCKKGEMFRVSVVATPTSGNKVCFSTDIPAVGGICTIVTSLSSIGEYLVTAPLDGYIGIYRNTLTGNCPHLYNIVPSLSLTRYFKEEIPTSYTNNKCIECYTGSADYGNLVSIGTNSWGVGSPIDVSNYAYIGVPVYYRNHSIFSDNITQHMAGGMFFDEGYKEDGSYDEGDNVANHIVGFPVIGVRCASDTEKTYITSIIKVPTGAKYYRQFSHIDDVNKKVVGFAEFSNVSPSSIESSVNQIIAGNASKISEKTIFELNPDTEILQKMAIVKKPKYLGSGDDSSIIPLVLAHVSDIHGSSARYVRYVEFANHWKTKNYVDELIDTGDVVSSTYSNGLSWRTAISGTDNILTVVGNHDTRANSTEQESAGLSSYSLWGYHSAISIDSSKRADVYNLLIKNNVSNWGVTQPTDAATNGLCYYYKDYAAKNIRLIALDVMGYNADEDSWLQARLVEANTAGLHVVVMAHFTGTRMDSLSCNYTSLSGVSEFSGGYNKYIEQTNPYAIPEAIDAFQEDGGIFIGYIIGHYHKDMVNVIHNYPKQLVFAVSSAGGTNLVDWTKVEGSKNYDDFQIISINTYDKTVRLIKIGADTDYYMRKKGTLCVGYTLVKDDGTEPGSGETATKVKGIIGEGW